MATSAVRVNTARGALLDAKTLLPNGIVAPHIASATVQTRNQMAEIAAKNLIAGVRGEKLQAWVNPEVAPKRRA